MKRHGFERTDDPWLPPGAKLAGAQLWSFDGVHLIRQYDIQRDRHVLRLQACFTEPIKETTPNA